MKRDQHFELARDPTKACAKESWSMLTGKSGASERNPVCTIAARNAERARRARYSVERCEAAAAPWDCETAFRRGPSVII